MTRTILFLATLSACTSTFDVERLRENVVAIVEQRDGDSQVVCGGTFVDQNLILTSAHCVTEINDDVLYAKHNDFDEESHRIVKQYHTARVVSIARNTDLALLAINDIVYGSSRPIRISNGQIKQGDEIALIAHNTESYPWSFARSDIASVRIESDSFFIPTSKKQISVVQTNVRAYGGNSGSGIINNDNELVAVGCWHSALIDDGTLLGVHRDEILDFLIVVE